MTKRILMILGAGLVGWVVVQVAGLVWLVLAWRQAQAL